MPEKQRVMEGELLLGIPFPFPSDRWMEEPFSNLVVHCRGEWRSLLLSPMGTELPSVVDDTTLDLGASDDASVFLLSFQCT